MKKMIIATMALFFLTPLGVAFSHAKEPTSLVGTWITQKPEKNARIEISPCAGNPQAFCGKIIELQEPTYSQDDPEAGKPKRDRQNPEGNLQSRPIVGLTILTGLRGTDENTWEKGEIYNPEDGQTYSCEGTLSKEGNVDTLNLRGFVGISLFGKTQTWKRDTSTGSKTSWSLTQDE